MQDISINSMLKLAERFRTRDLYVLHLTAKKFASLLVVWERRVLNQLLSNKLVRLITNFSHPTTHVTLTGPVVLDALLGVNKSYKSWVTVVLVGDMEPFGDFLAKLKFEFLYDKKLAAHGVFKALCPDGGMIDILHNRTLEFPCLNNSFDGRTLIVSRPVDTLIKRTNKMSLGLSTHLLRCKKGFTGRYLFAIVTPQVEYLKFISASVHWDPRARATKVSACCEMEYPI